MAAHQAGAVWRRQSGRELGNGGECGRPAVKVWLPFLLSLSHQSRAGLAGVAVQGEGQASLKGRHFADPS